MSDLKAFKGDTNVYDLTVLRLDAPVNLSTAKMWFTAKNDKDDLDADAVIALNTDDTPTQVFFPFPLQGKAQIIVEPSDTTDLIANAFYYDVQIVEASGLVTTIASGVLHVEDDVTKAYV